MKIRSILTCIMLSLPLYLNCKTFRCVYCFLYSSFLYSFIVPFFVVANKYLLTYLEAITLAIIWLEIVTKSYDELCHKISRSSLPLKIDSVGIIFQHRLRLGSLYFFNKKGL